MLTVVQQSTHLANSLSFILLKVKMATANKTCVTNFTPESKEVMVQQTIST